MSVNDVMTTQRKTSFVFVPVPEARLPKRLELVEERSLPVEYPLARLGNTEYLFEHKITLLRDTTSGELELQVLSPGPLGDLDLALPEDRFSLTGRFLRLTLIDVAGDTSEYKIRIELGSMTSPASRLTLSRNTNPIFGVALARYENGTQSESQLDFIGAIDIRGGYAPTVKTSVSAGEPVELGSVSGDLVLLS